MQYINQLLPELVENSLTEEELVKLLATRVEELLRIEPEKLLQLLYRLDVSEEKAKRALASKNPSVALAKEIIARELLRQEMRRRYSKKG